MKTKKILELLAPAKDLQCGISAINCGADAVYIGGPSFGARASAGNSIKDIEQLISYAHKFNAKVYVTINTILKDDELIEAEKLIHQLYKIKTDAIIIQDMGIFELDLPPIQIFASTQCNIDSVEKVQFFEQLGVKRVILPRELTLKEITDIKSNSDIDLEFFIHGALCVSYSGQCYLSHAIGGRSGNRGDCAQPCRKKYTLVDESNNILLKDKYLLSLKDLNLSEHLQDLIEAGITSFKIEGRMKNETYIKNIVSFYRQKFDEIIKDSEYKKSSSGQSIINFDPNPDKTFTRGYTSYNITGKRDDISSFNTPKAIGEKIGRVLSVSKGYIELDNASALNNGDGICYFDADNILKGALVNNVSNRSIAVNDTRGIQAGSIIYRNNDINFNRILEKSECKRKISADFDIFEQKNEIIFKITDEDAIFSEIAIKSEFETANNEEKAIENIKKQISKLGDSEFIANNINIELKTVPFIPVSELNEIRRNLTEKHILERLSSYKPIFAQIENKNIDFPVKNVNYLANIMNAKAKAFYEKHGAIVEEEALETKNDILDSYKGRVLMKTKHCLRESIGKCLKQCKNDTKKLYLVDEKGAKYSLIFDCNSCVMKVCK